MKAKIWIADTVYVLVTILKKRLNLDASLHTLLQILSATIFEKMPWVEAFSDNDYTSRGTDVHSQLNLFDS